MKRFYLERFVDASGVTGTGKVAEGVIFTNGWVAMTWITDLGFSGVAIYPSIEMVGQVHGHGGLTKVVFIDDPAETLAALPPRPD